jgi:threonine synthase
MIKYESSRNCQEIVSAHEAVIHGLAGDGGLYTPDAIPGHIDPQEILNCSYQETAAKIIGTMLDDYSEEEILACVKGAYDQKFDTEEIVPLRKISDGYLMELWHGPTSAFKDVALTILPRLLTAAYKKEKRDDKIAILTATSGDTGKAALSGFADVPHTAITVFYPEIGVSPIQKKQMQTSKGKNVEVIAVKGNFDDCQRMVKQAMSDAEVQASLQGVTLSSANSINIGRLVPQIVYYYSSYAKLVNTKKIACGDAVNFVVPTGNFGDILAGYMAKSLGLPIHKLICASNSNNVLTDFLKTGVYSVKRPFHTTMSPSMDILISSNLERLLFMMSGNDDVMVREMMAQLKDNGSYTVPASLKEKIQQEFCGYWTSEEDCAATMHDLFANENVLIDPHTSVALHAMRQYQSETKDELPCIVLSTASPYKFSHDVLKAVAKEDIADDFAAMDRLAEVSGMKVPAGLLELKSLPVRFQRSIEIKDGMHVIAERMKEIAHDHD